MRTFTCIISAMMAVGLLFSSLQAADTAKKVTSSVRQVTVFLNGAQVTREAKASLVSGTQTLRFTSLSAELDPGSIQVKGDGRFSILSVSSEMFYPSVDQPEVPTAEIDKLIAERSQIQKELKLEESLLQALNEAFAKEEAMLTQNQQFRGNETGTDLDRVKIALGLYRTRYEAVTRDRYAFEQKINDLRQKAGEKTLRITQLQQQGQAPLPIVKASREILVTLTAGSATEGKFTLIYQVKNAGWLPFYDLRVKDVSQPLELTYKARVFQNSGEDWENVKLTLSTGDPSKSSLAPSLNPWYLNYYTPGARRPVTTNQTGSIPTTSITANGGLVSGRIYDAQTGEGLLGATVVVQGTTVGTMVNENGEYSLAVPPGGSVLLVNYLGYSQQQLPISNRNRIDIPMNQEAQQLDEVVISADRRQQNAPMNSVSSRVESMNMIKKVRVKKETRTIPLIVNPVQKATNVEFEIREKYSIPEDGRPYTVEMTAYEMDAEYEYYCVPKLDLNAYLTARVSGWEDLNLLEGEANLYFEGTYLGKTLLNVRQVNDTMDISLGRDRNIVVKREKLEADSKNIISGKRRESRTFEIEVRNQKQQLVRISIEDQFPVSQNDEIEISRGEYEGAELEDLTGKLKWKLELEPNQSEKLKFNYEVKFPKGNAVQLE